VLNTKGITVYREEGTINTGLNPDPEGQKWYTKKEKKIKKFMCEEFYGSMEASPGMSVVGV
jgi:hypothetical protein